MVDFESVVEGQDSKAGGRFSLGNQRTTWRMEMTGSVVTSDNMSSYSRITCCECGEVLGFAFMATTTYCTFCFDGLAGLDPDEPDERTPQGGG